MMDRENDDEIEIIDGLGVQRLGHEEKFEVDLVRIRSTPETEALGYAGRSGEVMGETMPSKSRVTDVIGAAEEDYAINVWFDELRTQAWFAPHLIEPVNSPT
jgi:hypothetical protein